MSRLLNALHHSPLVAILRGLTPERADEVGLTLFNAGIRVLEVPINSPKPFESIRRLRAVLPDTCIIGAGTLMSISDLEQLASVGGEIAVMPHTSPEMITASIELGLLPMPGVFTPTEAFQAIQSGATHLKIFPANVAGQGFVKALKAVIPPEVRMYAVGGITPATLLEWSQVNGFGVGGSIFKPNDSLETIHIKATELHTASQKWMEQNQ